MAYDMNERDEFRLQKKPMPGSLLLWLLSKNLPLGHWPQYENNSEAVDFRGGGYAYWSAKQLDNAARKIVNSLSQYSVSERLAKEWEILPSLMRMRITAIANEAMTGFAHISNNVTKGILYFDKLVGGRVLARETGLTERTLKIIGGRKVSVQVPINPAIAGAQRAFAGFIRPPNYPNMSKAERKAINRSLAADRRAFKKRK